MSGVINGVSFLTTMRAVQLNSIDTLCKCILIQLLYVIRVFDKIESIHHLLPQSFLSLLSEKD
jgi:hypothetical protein